MDEDLFVDILLKNEFPWENMKTLYTHLRYSWCWTALVSWMFPLVVSMSTMYTEHAGSGQNTDQ